MTEVVDAATFAPIEGTDPALPGDPFTRVRYSYGQLLGAEDFTAEQKYHLLRARLRNALLHGTGVVAGLDIVARQTIDPPATELRCTAGLAIDALGREIYVPEAVCLDITGLAANASFWASLSPSPAAVNPPPSEEGEAPSPAEVDADADAAPSSSPVDRRRCYVVLSYRACLTAQTPAIAAPCSDADNALAWSRVLDSYRLCLEPAAPEDPFETVRDWTRIDEPPALRTRMQALLTNVPPALARLYAHAEDTKLLLATVDLETIDDRTTVVALDSSVRALLPPVQSIAEIALGTRLVGPAAPAAAAHFRALSAIAASDGTAISVAVTFSAPLQPLSITPDSVRILRFDPTAGWTELTPASSNITGAVLTLTLGEDWTGDTLWQIALSGGGAQPILDLDGHPLAGFADDPTPPPGRGHDAVRIATFSPA
ncbi:hypothetical protein PMI04_000690 [Sphingobium sp. AP49]|uniref:hypothetical protein n=1 Tax=Sphingobium sp. AP49 TaxID=1144307 RepID=UPI00026ECEC9|nr:hypothetical protein [Sphingobium sp. AP49]WHO39153.1 hypothetical protein PMI04_000690 [Sphingobium sp. AP49]